MSKSSLLMPRITPEREQRTKSKRETLADILRDDEKAERFIRTKFPRVSDREWMRAILFDYVSGKPLVLTKTLNDVTSVALDVVGSVRMQEIVSEKTGSDDVIPLIVREVTGFYSTPFLRIGQQYQFIQEPSIRGDGGFFIYRGKPAFEKTIRASLDIGRNIQRANQNYFLLRKILKEKFSESDFSAEELEQLKLQLRVGVKLDSAVQTITNLGELENIEDENYVSNAKNITLGNSPNISARLEAGGKELTLIHPEIRKAPVLVITTPEDIEKLNQETGEIFRVSEPETIQIKDKNWSSEVVLIHGYRASATSIPIRKTEEKNLNALFSSPVRKEEKISELEQSLLNDLSVLQSGCEFWNQRARELDFSVREEKGIEFWLLDEIFSFETGQREFNGLVQKGAIGIIDDEFGKRVIVAPEHYQDSLSLLGKETDKKHEWASSLYERVLEKYKKEPDKKSEQKQETSQPTGFFNYRLKARQGFHLMHYNSYLAADLIRSAANIVSTSHLDDLVLTYLNEELKLREQTDRNEREKRIGSIDFLVRTADSLKRKDFLEKGTATRKAMMKESNLLMTRLRIRLSMSRLAEKSGKIRKTLGEQDIEKYISDLKSIVNKYKSLLEEIEKLKGTEHSHEFYRAQKGVLGMIPRIYTEIGTNEQLSSEKRIAFLYRALDSSLRHKDFCFEDIKINGRKDRTVQEYITPIDRNSYLLNLIAELEKENNFSANNEFFSSLDLSDETRKISLMPYEQKLRYARRMSCNSGSISRKMDYERDLIIIYSRISDFSIKLGDKKRANMYCSLAENMLNNIELSADERQRREKSVYELRERLRQLN